MAGELLLLTITLMSGTEARINPKEIIAFLEAREANDPLKRYAPDTRCVIITTDGKEYTTREPCEPIEKRFKELKP